MSVNEKDILANEITLDQTSLSLVKGQSKKIEVTAIKPENATDKTVSWSSSDATVAKVDQNGFVTPVKEGTATITATVNGQSATCKVTVEEKKANEPTKPCTAYNGKSSSLPETGTTAPATRSLVTKAFSTKTETSSSHPTPRAASISSIAPERMVRICTTAMPPTRAESTQSSENPRLTRWRYLRPEPST